MTPLGIPAPRQPLLAEQVDANAILPAMVDRVAVEARAVDFAAMPATVRCEIMIAVSDLFAALQAAALMHPVVTS